MEVTVHSNVGAWLEAVSPLLYQAEAENNLLLGLAEQALRQPDLFPRGVHGWSVTDGRAVVGAAFVTPPHNLILSRQPPACLSPLADALTGTSLSPPGVMGVDDNSRQFAELWSARTGASARVRMRQRLHECTEVVWRERLHGEFRLAQDRDVHLLSAWRTAFEIDAFSAQVTADPVPGIRRQVKAASLFVWTVDGQVVSCAAKSRETRSGVSVNYVYTPPEFRGLGYATSCVADLTERELRAGRRFCCLFTDLANPTPNAIYAKIGYRKVCDSEWWEFGGESG